jgi:hypothetical protein
MAEVSLAQENIKEKVIIPMEQMMMLIGNTLQQMIISRKRQYLGTKLIRKRKYLDAKSNDNIKEKTHGLFHLYLYYYLDDTFDPLFRSMHC